MPDRDPEVKQHTRLLTALIWAGIGLAPIAAIIVLISGSTGAMRFAVLLVAVCVVLIGAAMLIRTDPVLHRMDVEDRVSAEVDALRGGLRDEMTATARATNNRVQALEDEMGALRSGPAPAPGPPARPPAGSARPAPSAPRISAPISAPIGAAAVPAPPPAQGPAPVPAQRGAGSARVGSASVAVPGNAADKPAQPRISDPSLHGGPGAARSGVPASAPRSGAAGGSARVGAAASRAGQARPDGPPPGRAAASASVSPPPYDSYEPPKGPVRAASVAPGPEAPAPPRRRHAAPDTSTDLARAGYAEPSPGYGLTTGNVTPQPGVYGGTYQAGTAYQPDDAYDSGDDQGSAYQSDSGYENDNSYENDGYAQAAYDNTGYAQDGYDQAEHYGSAPGHYGTAQAGHYGSAQAGEYGSAQAGEYGSVQAGEYGSAQAAHDDYEQAEQTGYEQVEQADYAEAGYDQPGYPKQGNTYGASSYAGGNYAGGGYTDTGDVHADTGDADSGYHESREEAGYGTTYSTPTPGTYGRSTVAPETPSSYDSSDFVSAGSYGYGGPVGIAHERDDDHHHYAPDPIPARNVYQSR